MLRKMGASDARARGLLGLVLGGPLDRLPRLAQPRRAFDEKAPDVLSVLTLEPPEEEPLDDLAQLLPGLPRREEGRAGGRGQGVQCGP